MSARNYSNALFAGYTLALAACGGGAISPRVATQQKLRL